ncbi:hypothetical protein ACUXAV_004842 [Cupriavidus metallidurans]|jgi:hypothetical protein|uniref:Uncharacterized protein n=4 Tax=Cupriavidus TaxID=106589 RepID=Q1LA86_CUPMC|nr:MULTISPECIES: hypothetical protein [Cupriavidus]ABF12940.1 hypothetical protein Rmet_6081 [Cupriavidus metallidurans CH34]AZG11956.1 hypothetical protein EHF44_00245 [Cupriavidus pauculus]MDE4922442.1 hypothetical protein [Cupriavidus metallidurans]MWL91898.1 hypothetical protein [Cupriavidus sp. SW-Y-13]QBP14582.1 hypothetical protein DDF84_033370 [Cupriavidus metallidurans]
MTNSLIRPTVGEVYQLLQGVSGLLVHFSGAPKGAGKTDAERLWFPDDLQKVLDGKAQGGLSASVVMPGDRFGQHYASNAVGCVGVILGLHSPQSLRCADAADCGSWTDQTGSRMCDAPASLSIQELALTISNRRQGCYNEWVIADYIPLGILAMPPFEVRTGGSPSDLPGGGDLSPELAGDSPVEVPKFLDLASVRRVFPSQPLYTMTGEGIALVGPDDSTSIILHDQIY